MLGKVLSQADILLLKSYADAKDAVSYYELLIEKGYDYGHLALGVVEGNTLAGVAARLYAETVAVDDGITLSESEWQAITNELMQADFLARKQLFNANPSQPVELGWQPVLDYHVTVFGAHGLPEIAEMPMKNPAEFHLRGRHFPQCSSADPGSQNSSTPSQSSF